MTISKIATKTIIYNNISHRSKIDNHTLTLNNDNFFLEKLIKYSNKSNQDINKTTITCQTYINNVRKTGIYTIINRMLDKCARLRSHIQHTIFYGKNKILHKNQSKIFPKTELSLRSLCEKFLCKYRIGNLYISNKSFFY